MEQRDQNDYVQLKHDIDPRNWIYTEVMYNENNEIGPKIKLYTGYECRQRGLMNSMTIRTVGGQMRGQGSRGATTGEALRG